MRIGSLQTVVLAGLLALAVGGAAVAADGPRGAAPVIAEQTLYKFCPQAGCTDGFNPGFGSLLMDGPGNLYGTTFYGGTGYYGGTVFKLAPNGTGWTETVLYNFCSQGGSYCTDGAEPNGGLVMDGAGNLYGTAPYGGKYNGGAAFQLSPNGSSWTQSVLYSFCSQGGSSCTDGGYPYTGLIMDAAKNLYGTTFAGGAHNGGTVFTLVLTGSGATETVLYSFCAQTSCADGADPAASLIMDGAGNLYGTTLYGGNNYCLTNNANPCGDRKSVV
jgi:uncharacterized repeat protein (TIGR03803 family)